MYIEAGNSLWAVSGSNTSLIDPTMLDKAFLSSLDASVTNLSPPTISKCFSRCKSYEWYDQDEITDEIDSPHLVCHAVALSEIVIF